MIDPHLQKMIEHGEMYRHSHPGCGWCDNKVDEILDATHAVAEVDEKMDELLAVQVEHPGAAVMPQVTEEIRATTAEIERQIRVARGEPEHILTHEVESPPQQPAGPIREVIGRAHAFLPMDRHDVRGFMQETRSGILDIVPRPLKILRNEYR